MDDERGEAGQVSEGAHAAPPEIVREGDAQELKAWAQLVQIGEGFVGDGFAGPGEPELAERAGLPPPDGGEEVIDARVAKLLNAVDVELFKGTVV
jgi:hypothetical protein